MEWEAELIRQLLDFADELEQEGRGFHLHIFAKRRCAVPALLTPMYLASSAKTRQVMLV